MIAPIFFRPPFLLAIFFIFPGGLASKADAAGRVALIIGVDNYENVEPLGAALSDADLIASTLQSIDPPFDVTLLRDTDMDEAEDAFEKFLDTSANAECALLYFAGHGVEYYDENYLLVKDTKIPEGSTDPERMKRKLRTEMLSLQGMVDDMEDTKANIKLVILDCCRDNPLKADASRGTRSLGDSKGGLAQVKPPRGTLICYSADAGQVASDGLFTVELVKQIKGSGLPILKVFAATREKVSELSARRIQERIRNGGEGGAIQEPAEYSKLSLSGTDFTFTKSGKIGPTPVSVVNVPSSDKMAGKLPGESREIAGIPMQWCPPGEFFMGSPPGEADRNDDERQHRVILRKGFWISRTECTQGQWKKVMGANPSMYSGDDLPVEKVSWYECKDWVEKMNQRSPVPGGWKWKLPTEAQWEYACRAGTDTAYAYGSYISAESVKYDTKDSQTVKVGNYPPNRWGLVDVHGNVQEWCADWYNEKYYGEGQKDPSGPESGSFRIFRGGSWVGGEKYCRSAHRGRFKPDFKHQSVGFRPVLVGP